MNNAGVGMVGPLEGVSMDRIRDLFETNTLGTIAMTQAVLSQFRERGSGVIVNATSGGLVLIGYQGVCSTRLAWAASAIGLGGVWKSGFCKRETAINDLIVVRRLTLFWGISKEPPASTNGR